MRKNFLGTENDFLNIAKFQNIFIWGEYENYYILKFGYVQKFTFCPS